MKKRLLSLVAVGWLAIPLFSYGAGLGSVRTHSNLNERLNAEIPVLSVRKHGNMSVALASNAAFAQRGVARSRDLNSLRFSLIKKAQRYYVKVSSSKPITSPYLNFVLELKDDSGKSYRKYAIFLDPAKSNTKNKNAKLSTVEQSKRRYGKTVAKKPSYKKAVNNKVANNKVSSKKAYRSKYKITKRSARTYGPVKSGESLSVIAQRVRPSKKISIPAMMRLLETVNPRLKKYGLQADTVLKVPAIKGYPYRTSQVSVPKTDKVKQQKSVVNQPEIATVVEEQEVANIVNEQEIAAIVGEQEKNAVKQADELTVGEQEKPVVNKIKIDEADVTSVATMEADENKETVSDVANRLVESAEVPEVVTNEAVAEIEPITDGVTDNIKATDIAEASNVADNQQAEIESNSGETAVGEAVKKSRIISSLNADEAQPVAEQVEVVESASVEPAQVENSKSSKWSLLGASIIAILGLLLLLFWKRKQSVTEENVVLLDNHQDDSDTDTVAGFSISKPVLVTSEKDTTDDALSQDEEDNSVEELDEELSQSAEEADDFLAELDEHKEQNFEAFLSSIDGDEEELIDFDDEVAVDVEMQLAMAETFMSADDFPRAKKLLKTIIKDGSVEQVEKAEALLEKIG